MVKIWVQGRGLGGGLDSVPTDHHFYGEAVKAPHRHSPPLHPANCAFPGESLLLRVPELHPL